MGGVRQARAAAAQAWRKFSAVIGEADPRGSGAPLWRRCWRRQRPRQRPRHPTSCGSVVRASGTNRRASFEAAVADSPEQHSMATAAGLYLLSPQEAEA